jgi:hypothetical protein
VLRTAFRAPRANAVRERSPGRVRRERVDHLLILGERHPGRVLAEYVAPFNAGRPHRGVDRRPPLPADTMARPWRSRGSARVVAVPVLGGLHHDHRLVAQPARMAHGASIGIDVAATRADGRERTPRKPKTDRSRRFVALSEEAMATLRPLLRQVAVQLAHVLSGTCARIARPCHVHRVHSRGCPEVDPELCGGALVGRPA